MSAPPEFNDVRVERVTVNDDTVKIVDWHMADGAWVRRGALLYTVETSKATFDVNAEVDGDLEISAAVGDQVEVGAVIGKLWMHGTRRPQASKPEPAASTSPVSTPSSDVSATGRLVSRKAQALLDEHTVDPSEIPGTGMIRESDVLMFVAARAASTPVPHEVEISPGPGAMPQDASAQPVTASRPQYVAGDPMSEAKSAAAARGHGVVWLALNYVVRTWLLTNLARWAPRGLLIPIHRLRGVRIGADCFIDPTATLETAHAYNISIGNDVRVTAGAIIMTHIKAPNYLRESGIMPAVLRPVVLEDHCFVGVNSVVMPGVRVGKASVVASGSVVLADVPAFTMVSGNPARVVKTFAPYG